MSSAITDCPRGGLARALRRILKPGATVALGDGVGALRIDQDGNAVCRVLGEVARETGNIRLVLGWMPESPLELDAGDFTDVVVLMPGWGARGVLRHPRARYIPVSLAAIPSVLATTLRPDVVVTRVVERRGQYHFATEVSWQRELADSGVPVLALVDEGGPSASAVGPIGPTAVTVVGATAEGPTVLPHREPDDVHEEIANRVLPFVPPGAHLQYGPGQLGTALLRRCSVPVSLQTGLLTDAAVDLANRGKLIGVPTGTYLIGSERLYEWADGRPLLHGIGYTHDLTRLSRVESFISINTAIEIDQYGQVNVEGVGDNVVGGIGGHPDFCLAGKLSRSGLSIIAVESSFKGRSPFVEHLSRPASTPAHDIDVVVTERGHADLRGCDWKGRREVLSALFGAR